MTLSWAGDLTFLVQRGQLRYRCPFWRRGLLSLPQNFMWACKKYVSVGLLVSLDSAWFIDSPLVSSRHMCMVMRGVQKMNSKTVTSTMLGVFREDPKTREEFLTLIRSWNCSSLKALWRWPRPVSLFLLVPPSHFSNKSLWIVVLVFVQWKTSDGRWQI